MVSAGLGIFFLLLLFYASFCLFCFVLFCFFLGGRELIVALPLSTLEYNRIPENCQGVLEKIAGVEGGYNDGLSCCRGGGGVGNIPLLNAPNGVSRVLFLRALGS